MRRLAVDRGDSLAHFEHAIGWPLFVDGGNEDGNVAEGAALAACNGNAEGLGRVATTDYAATGLDISLEELDIFQTHI